MLVHEITFTPIASAAHGKIIFIYPSRTPISKSKNFWQYVYKESTVTQSQLPRGVSHIRLVLRVEIRGRHHSYCTFFTHLPYLRLPGQIRFLLQYLCIPCAYFGFLALFSPKLTQPTFCHPWAFKHSTLTSKENDVQIQCKTRDHQDSSHHLSATHRS